MTVDLGRVAALIVIIGTGLVGAVLVLQGLNA